MQNILKEILKNPVKDKYLLLKHSWNSEDSSPNITVKEDQMTMFRHPTSESTDCIRGKVGFTQGIHVWEIVWKVQQRGTHAIVGVATSSAQLHASSYKALVGSSSDSWGWDLGKNKLYHNSECTGIYPKMNDCSKLFMVPDKFFVILDMNAGTLSFLANGINLGIAFIGLKGKTLFPIVSTVWGHCEVTMTYMGVSNSKPRNLFDISKKIIIDNIQNNEDNIQHLPLPNTIKSYLRDVVQEETGWTEQN